MPKVGEVGLRSLRLRYNAVYTAHQSCVQALYEPRMSGEPLSAELLEKETHALRELTAARGNLLAAIQTANDN